MKKKSTIRKILNYIKKYRWLMLLSILLAALTVEKIPYKYFSYS